MSPHRSKSAPAHRPVCLGLSLLGAAFVLGGCAQVPESGPAPALRSADHFESSRSLGAQAAAAAAWPTERWWRAYGDPQLDTLIDEALAGSPTLAQATARARQAQAASAAAGSATKPQVSVNATAYEERLSENFLYPQGYMPTGMNDYGRASLDLHWDLDFWGRQRAALAAATSQEQAAQAELAQVRLLLAAGVAAEYAELSRLHASRDTAEQALVLRSKTAELIGKRQANGLETLGSLRHVQALVALAEGDRLALDEQLQRQRLRIAALLGAGPDRALAITRPALRADRAWGLPAQLGADLLGRRPDVVAARLAAQAGASRVEQARAEYYPNVNLSAFVGVQALGLNLLGDSGSRIGGFGPAISLPIFTAGRLDAQLRGAQAAHAQAVAGYHAALSHALAEVADSAVALKALDARLAKAQEAVQASTDAHRVARNRYEGGLASYLEVLSAEDGLLRSLSAQTHLRALSLSLDIGLQRALGGGYRSPDPAAAPRS